MNFKIFLSTIAINFCLAIWPIITKRSGLSPHLIILLYYIGSLSAIATIWYGVSTTAGTLQVKWAVAIVALGLLGGYCMNRYTTIIMNPNIQAGLFMVLSALMYATFSPLLDWLINGSKLSGVQRLGMLFAVVAVYCLGQRK